jgi:hypothetical protein
MISSAIHNPMIAATMMALPRKAPLRRNNAPRSLLAQRPGLEQATLDRSVECPNDPSTLSGLRRLVRLWTS